MRFSRWRGPATSRPAPWRRRRGRRSCARGPARHRSRRGRSPRGPRPTGRPAARRRRSSKDGATLRAQSAQLGLDEAAELRRVEVLRLLRDRLGQAELAEQVTRGRGEHTVLAGDRRGDLVECGGVDHGAVATAGRRRSTCTPCAVPTAWTAWSTTVLRSLRLMPKPRSPPRVEDPSRRPAASSACTWLTQPGPSAQVSLTRSAMAPGLLPAAPANLRRLSLTASVSTGPKRCRCAPAWSP